MTTINSWIKNETETADFNDKRLSDRYAILLEKFSSKPESSINGSLENWGESMAAYRFFNNKKVNAEKILKPHYNATLERIKMEKTVLLVQDTSRIDFKGKKDIPGLGPMSHETEQGFHLHPMLAVTPDRLLLGCVKHVLWARDELGASAKKESKPIEEKESFRWLECFQKSHEIACLNENTKIVNVCDREGDIYEIFHDYHSCTLKNRSDFIIRATQNRKIKDESDSNINLLWDKISAQKSIGELEFKLRRRDNKPTRQVKQQIKACEVELLAPKRKGMKLLNVKVNVILCEEINPPEGEEPVIWLLLTTLPTNNKDQVLKVVNYYLCRWEIEIFFKVLKSGCKVEEVQLKTFSRIQNCLAMFMIIAWRIMYLTMLGREFPNISCSAVFDEAEWKSVYQVVNKKKPPKNPPTLGEMIAMIASLGGFKNRKHDGSPGVKTMWKGLQRMHDFTISWLAFSEIESNGRSV